jgi:hypothetical protein
MLKPVETRVVRDKEASSRMLEIFLGDQGREALASLHHNRHLYPVLIMLHK